MKLTKFLTTVSLIFFLTFPSFANITLDECKGYLREAAIALKETTEDLEIANNIIKQQEELIFILRSQIPDTDSAMLLERIKELEGLLEEARSALDDNNIVLEKAVQRIKDDQKEIERLRKELQSLINITPDVELFTVGGGYVQPTGIQILFMFKIPKIRISVYSNVNFLILPEFGMNFTIGAAYRF